jgi:hypothetical protein
MNDEEFTLWREWTATSRCKWTVDPIHNGLNDRDLLAHLGGEAGRYVQVDRDGTLNLGTYTDAVPHIGEALFTPTITRRCADFTAALTLAMEAGGVAFLRDLLT